MTTPSPDDRNPAEGPADAPGAEPRWLTPRERAAWLILSGLLTRLPAALDQDLQRNAGLTYYEYMVLAILSEQPDRTLRLSDLAGFTYGSLSRLSHVVTRLQKRGWLTREPDPSDGRYTTAVLTEAGWEKVVATAPGHVRTVRELVIDAVSPDDLDRLREIGEAIMARVDPEGTFRPAP